MGKTLRRRDPRGYDERWKRINTGTDRRARSFRKRYDKATELAARHHCQAKPEHPQTR